ncbi:MAG: hypothetical protein KJ928_02895, partial [Candidatus Altiarchaeota archaeon]|nr:hypothetical protein [Candidatus Altiarchaeota archaeon]
EFNSENLIEFNSENSGNPSGSDETKGLRKSGGLRTRDRVPTDACLLLPRWFILVNPTSHRNDKL